MKSLRRENILYLLAFGLALALRLYHLGALPLSDGEASWALQALGAAQGARPVLGSQTAYILPTSLLFFLLGAGTNFLARLFPALAGSLLVFAPRLFRERLKPRPSLILAFFLALDPSLEETLPVLRDARNIAWRIRSWVPHRHRFPANACCASSRVTSGLRASNAAPVITIPVMQ